MKIIIPTVIVTYTQDELEKWKNGDREDCMDPYCRKLAGSRGFGEYVAGRYYERLGYNWLHHDYNLFGGNDLGAFPRGEAILRKTLGDDRFEKGRGYYPSFSPFIRIEEPDLMVYKPDYSELRFAECKRRDTGDKLREVQVRGLALLSLLFNCPVEVIEIIEESKGTAGAGEPLVWEFN